MMKRFFWLFVSILLVSWFSMAVSIGDVDVDFCHPIEQSDGSIKATQNRLNLSMDANEEKEICIDFTNKSSALVSLYAWFVDGTLTNDDLKSKACKSEWKIQNFGQFVKWLNETFLIKPGETVRKHATIEFPKWMWWQILGCLTYYLDVPKSDQNQWMLSLLVRKANFIDILLSWDFSVGLEFLEYDLAEDIDIEYLGTNPKVKSYFDVDWSLKFEMFLENLGTVPQELVLTGKLTNIFGYQKDVILAQRTLPGQEGFSLIWKVEKLPFYGWPFKFEVEVDYAVPADFNVELLDDSQLWIRYIVESSKLMVFSWFIVIIVVIIVLLIIFLIYRRKQKSKKKPSTPKPIKHKKDIVAAKKSLSKKSLKKKVVKKPVVKKKIAKKKTARVTTKKSAAKKTTVKKKVVKKKASK